MKKLFSRIEWIVFIFSFIFSLVIYGFFSLTTVGSVQIIRLTQAYALLALLFLWVSLAIKPWCKTFPLFVGSNFLLRIQKGVVISTLYVGILHSCIAFFGQLHGFSGLFFLSNKYIYSIFLSFIALIILFIVCIFSFGFIHERVKHKVEIHNLLYVSGLLILIHALLLGTHFQSLSSLIPQLTFSLIFILLLLDSYQADYLLKKRYKSYPQFGILFTVTSCITLVIILLSFIPSSLLPQIGIHAAHIELAKEQEKNAQTQSTIPGLDGDKTRRFYFNVKIPPNISPNQDTELDFSVFQAENGSPVYFFKTPYEKPMHLVIIDNDFSYFSHIHPVQQNNIFSITTKFPHPGGYHLYSSFQPFGGIEQEFSYGLNVGQEVASSPISPSFEKKKRFGDYIVEISYPPLKAQQMTEGQQHIRFTITDSKTHKPTNSLKPYLNAFGHMVMINTKSYDYLHVHPTNLKAPSLNSLSGPTVDFLPVGIYGPFKRGVYKVFAEFNPDGKLFVSDFYIEVE